MMPLLKDLLQNLTEENAEILLIITPWEDSLSRTVGRYLDTCDHVEEVLLGPGAASEHRAKAWQGGGLRFLGLLERAELRALGIHALGLQHRYHLHHIHDAVRSPKHELRLQYTNI